MEERGKPPTGRWSPPKPPANFGLDVLRLGLVFASLFGIAALFLLTTLRLGKPATTAIALTVIIGAFLACLFVWWRMRRENAVNRFAGAVAAWGALSLVLLIFMAWGGATEPDEGLHIYLWPYWARVLVALSPTIPVAGTVAALLKYLVSEPDEFQRMLTTRAVLWAMGATFVVLTGWSFLSMYADAPPVPAPLVMGGFWVAYAIAGPIVRWTYR